MYTTDLSKIINIRGALSLGGHNQCTVNPFKKKKKLGGETVVGWGRKKILFSFFRASLVGECVIVLWGGEFAVEIIDGLRASVFRRSLLVIKRNKMRNLEPKTVPAAPSLWVVGE